jgi:hypothetical protein
MLKDMSEGSIDARVTTTTLLVGESPCITHASHHKAVTDTSRLGLMTTEPGDRADRTGDEQEAM